MWGSYGQQNIHATYNSVKDDQKSITKLMLGRAENDFNFKNNRAELRQMVHSDYDLWSVAHSRLWSLSEKADIEAHVWFRGQRLNLGPTIHQDTSEAQQRDKSYRGLIKWRTRWNKIDIKNDLAILHDRIRYTDPQISIDDPANSTVYNWRFNVSRFYKNYKTYGGLDLNYATAKSANYNDSQKRWASNVFLGIHKYWQKGHRTEFLVKQYWFEDQFLTPSFKLQHRARLSDRWAMVAAGARALRIPSMNDLYWSPGGNAQLKPESAWKSEFTVQFNKSSNNNFEADLSGFSTWTRDWILWRPVSGTLWSPVNIRKVWSRGFNAQIENEWNIGSDQKLLTSISYEYVRATYQNSLNVRDISIGKQLIYTPQHSANFRLSYHHKNLELGTTTVYKGTTYTSSDNIQKLPDYVLIDAHMGCHLSIGKMEGLIEISSKNINNQSYQVITARAMPLRNYYVKLILNTN